MALEPTRGNRSDSPVTGKWGQRLGALRRECGPFEGRRPWARSAGAGGGQMLPITRLRGAVVLGEEPAGSGGT